jgi:hypothetical protein
MPYQPHPHHRNSQFADQKSQWSIPVQDEQQCYNHAVVHNWIANGTYWGLYIINAAPCVFGVAQNPPATLHIAKFVGDTANNWHGYPVAPWLSPYDKPAAALLQIWLNTGYINTPTMSKIHRGKRCAL